MRSVNDILKLVCTFLNQRNIDYCIVGGFAVIIHGNPRSTMDIDFVIGEKDILDIVKDLLNRALTTNGYLNEFKQQNLNSPPIQKSRCILYFK